MPISTKPLLERGVEGPEVAYLQTLLHVLGYNSDEIDGVFDLNTESRVKSFQSDCSLPIDGIVNEPTWTTIESKIGEIVSRAKQPQPQQVQSQVTTKTPSWKSYLPAIILGGAITAVVVGCLVKKS